MPITHQSISSAFFDRLNCHLDHLDHLEHAAHAAHAAAARTRARPDLGEHAALSARRPSRPDLLPVVIGGDIGGYALARQLHDATGQRVTLLSPSPIEAIALSS